MKIAALIPARSGSKGLEDKNMQTVGGMTLINIAVWHASMISKLRDVYVSSDSERYIEHSEDIGASPIMRPAKLAEDMTPTIEVVKHAAPFIDADYIAIFQPTHPFRMMQGIIADLPAFLDSGNRSGCSYRQTDEHIYRRYKARSEAPLLPVNRAWGMRPRRQDRTHDFYIDSGEFFIMRNGSYLETALDIVHGDEQTSPHVFPGCLICDIHDQADLDLANRLWKPEFLGGVDARP